MSGSKISPAKFTPPASLDDFINSADGATEAPATPTPTPTDLREGTTAGRSTTGRGRKKKLERPWENIPAGQPKNRSQLLLDPQDKARLDFLNEHLGMSQQQILRSYIQDALRDDAEGVFMKVSPESPPPQDD